jgi:hypothetical protein
MVSAGAMALVCPAGCSPAPSQNIVGSFFPAWMLCAGIGFCAAVACRVILGAVRLDKQVLAPLVGYLAVAVAVTLFTWLTWFGQ